MATVVRKTLDLPFTPAGDLGQGYKKGYEIYDGADAFSNSGSPALSRRIGSTIGRDKLRMKSSRDSLLELKSSAFKRFNGLPGLFHRPSPLPMSLGGTMIDIEDVSPLPRPFDFDRSPSPDQDTSPSSGCTGFGHPKQFDPVWGNLDASPQHMMDDADPEPLFIESSPELDFKSELNPDGLVICLDSDTMLQNKDDEDYQDFRINSDNIRNLMTRPILQDHNTPAVQPMAPSLVESLLIHTSHKLAEPMSGTRSPYALTKRRRVGSQDPEEEQMEIHEEDPMVALDQSPESRSHGEEIKSALERSEEQLDYIGDFSQCHSLPLTRGKHQDLKSITADTMAALLKGYYNHVVQSFSIIDCRYPYEFEGGHIKGAQNIYTKKQLMEQFLAPEAIPGQPQESGKRNILVFHCEFSSERGPKMSRFLRSQDRHANQDRYPSLHYPEVYLLDQGYKEFFQHHRDLCTPSGYLAMLHEAYGDDLKHFRAKSKSWAGETRQSKVKDVRAAGGRKGRSRVFEDIPQQQRRLSYEC